MNMRLWLQFVLLLVARHFARGRSVMPAPANDDDAQGLLQIPEHKLKKHCLHLMGGSGHLTSRCFECSYPHNSSKFRLFCGYCCRFVFTDPNITHNALTEVRLPMANPEGTVSHLWKTKKERKLRKSTIHSFQTVKPQFQNCDGSKAVRFWIQIQVFGDYAQAFGVAFFTFRFAYFACFATIAASFLLIPIPLTMLSQKWDWQWRIQKARFPTCERLKKKENSENPLFTVSRLWNHSFKTVMVQRQCVSGFKFKFSVIMHRRGIFTFRFAF